MYIQMIFNITNFLIQVASRCAKLISNNYVIINLK